MKKIGVDIFSDRGVAQLEKKYGDDPLQKLFAKFVQEHECDQQDLINGLEFMAILAD